MLHRANLDDDKDIADVRLSSELNFMLVCTSGKIGFYALRLLYKDSEHEEQENLDMQEALELGVNSNTVSIHPPDQWG